MEHEIKNRFSTSCLQFPRILCFSCCRSSNKHSTMSFHLAMSKTLWFGNVLGLMPIIGVNTKEIRLKSILKSLHCCLIFIGSTFFFLTTFTRSIEQRNFSLDRIMSLAVYSTNILTIVLFLKLGGKWLKLIKTWSLSEEDLSPDWSNSLTHQLNLRLFVVMSSSIGEFGSIKNFRAINLKVF
jgi:hypothetical protein